MSEALLRDAIRIIQDVVAASKGSPLDRESVKRLEQALAHFASGERLPPAGAEYSEREATILFADLRGFSAIAASYPTGVVLTTLSRCFGRLTEVIVAHYGTIDKFMGDAIMAVFYGDAPAHDHVRRALLCAVEMQLAMNELRSRHRDERLPEIYIGIGINTGKVMAGLIGSDAYRAYTVIGEQVNLASRIEAFSLRGQILMSEATYAHCKDFVHAGEPMDVHVKGRSDSLTVREALAIPDLGKTVPRQDQRKSPRVPVRLELEYWTVGGKLVDKAPLRGGLRDISYHGALAELAGPLPLYGEIKLSFHLPCVRVRATDVYARVLGMREQDGRHLAGVEFTSLHADTSKAIQLLVQLCIQNECPEAKGGG